ncbi:MAG: NADH-ubiquinone oxidoreductase-F iron-sulfur binding region domain-containing protein [Planctomycetota bacterium]|nr:NADH-ubiquinone oxidoreductase-F iron-sulfur binding region domain-containing protein [Planctomycetota bacterium]MEC8653569.1 NADH-ubiquinone oxidoreductase-F iron-sulfur binding region domain-containing protein [Planctomycetota bacterium]MEC9047832.1 NADH-ubiquinone oxidoreductase-F iron-sulfur binding region domain-containing protein [Planctomycetota bacterium]
MSAKVYVPRDSAALSMGADQVADAVVQEAGSRGVDVQLVRNGSRGMLWLEPLVEVETEAGRVAYGPVTPADVKGLFDASFTTGGEHALGHGRTDDMPWMQKQTRLTFERVGVTDPVDYDQYVATGGTVGLKKALQMEPSAIVEEVVNSGLRGRGGAGFPAGIKWRTVLGADADQKYIACNADEGDSGTYSDRMCMEGDPYLLIEGMVLAGLAVGANEGYIYLRSEYPDARVVLTTAIERARAAGMLGQDVFGSGKAFELFVRLGAGSYVCGEETAMLESLEGKRGIVRAKPPLPALEGLWGKPTVVNNVMTLAAVPWILAHGGEAYAAHGVGRSKGTMPYQLAGNIKHGGLIEVPFGVTVRELLYDFGGGSLSGRPIKAVQVGGPLGAYLPESKFDAVAGYEELSAVQGLLGHGGLVAYDDATDMSKMARYAMEFCAIESCGKCTPCRIGSTRGAEVIDRLVAGQDRKKQEALLRDLCDTMTSASLCAMGGLTPLPVLSALDHFPEDFAKV